MVSRETILVHSCCASCSSYVLEHLAERFDVTAYWYNPNIQPAAEHDLRLGEMRDICARLGIGLLEGQSDPAGWDAAVAPLAQLGEKSDRCRICYRHRLEETARKASEAGFSLFTTTLSVSPHKIHGWIAAEGAAAGERHGVRFHDEDFKKKGGFQESCRKSREQGLTRQDYCGCLYSLQESIERKKARGGD